MQDYGKYQEDYKKYLRHDLPASNFQSHIIHLGPCEFPKFSNLRIMMLPLILGDTDSIPDFLQEWRPLLKKLFMLSLKKCHIKATYGEVCYLTIDEKFVKAGTVHRRPGLHVDGIYKECAGSWGGGVHGFEKGGGFLTASSVSGCKVYQQHFFGKPNGDGSCEHLRDQCQQSFAYTIQPNHLIWMSGLAVHESIPMKEDANRTFIRLSLPSDGPWFEGYTENPLGIKPSGKILPRRAEMDWEP